MRKQKPTDPLAEVYAARRRNLLLLIDQYDGGVALSERLGYCNSSYVSQLATEHRKVSERTARGIEAKLGLATGWMDKGTRA